MDYKFSTPNGSYLKTPNTQPVIEVLENTDSHDKKRYEYSNGLIFIIDIIDGVPHIDSNYKWTRKDDGKFYPVYEISNPDFVDERAQ